MFTVLFILKWLLQEQNEWQSDEDYLKGSEIVRNCLVVNDVAERNVKLCNDFICTTGNLPMVYISFKIINICKCIH